MINTYHTSMAPPPIPPRMNRYPFLIPAPEPSRGYSKALLRFLAAVVLLHFLLSLGGFVYLLLVPRKGTNSTSIASKKGNNPSDEGKVAFHTSERERGSDRAMARMTVMKHSNQTESGYLQWNMAHSSLRDIYYYKKSWLTVELAGDYFISSRVTFSKGKPEQPLISWVKLRKYKEAKEEDVMKAYCSLGSRSQVCTASQGEMITLEKGNQLSVWVEDLSQVDYDVKATTFGMHRL
ncbi:CD40 ligand [Genypterus blacodes]|uniref:CD40 ligand n=1 Tax=Genypterus blacodes TaxID=154954 RepID=UPI003F777672